MELDIDRVENKIIQLKDFFKSIKENNNITSYGAGAEYGYNSSVTMLKTLEVYKNKKKNSDLKRIYAGFTAVTRGVEGFNDKVINEKFYEVCKGIYEIKQEIRSLIKW